MLFTRHPDNPILHPGNVPFDARLVFNPGVAVFQGRYLMVFRYERGDFDGHLLERTALGRAVSADGVHWKVDGELSIPLDISDLRRVYDPRLTVLDSRLYLSFAADTDHGIRAGLAVSDDGLSFEVLDLSLPDNRNQVLFPERIGGYYWRLERPFPVYGRGGGERFDIWMSRSPDLVHWGASRLVLGVEDVPWANAKIGPGAPPIRTDRGWLVLFHAVDIDPARGKNGWEKRWTKRYTAGAALLDAEQPWLVRGVCPEPVLVPDAPYETRDGFRLNVVFPGAAIASVDGLLRMYYGAADTVVCLAEARLDDVLAACTAPGGASLSAMTR
ncbi:MAG: glycoside hydrolase family 130 protein [Spirochaetales bacterium]|nr:glycoside hydrolase family 130 protein [Spirochaetales bacterium]